MRRNKPIIAYIANSKVPSQDANSVHVMKMCQAFAQEGFQPTLIVPQLVEAKDDQVDIWRHYGIQTHFPIEWLSIDTWPGKYQRFSLRTIRRAQAHGAAIIYTRYLLASLWAALLRIPTVLEVHAPIDRRGISNVYFRMLLRSKQCRRIVVITHALRDELIKQHQGRLDPNRTLVAPDAVDLENYYSLATPEQARKQLAQEEKFTIGYAGNLYTGRGIEIILELAQSLNFLNFMVIGGKEQDISRYHSHLTRLGIQNVQFVGFIANTELPNYLAACEILLMPYQTSVQVSGGGDTARWMSPMKMFEYMATGRLIISSDLPVLREVLNENNAILCPAADIASWRKAVETAYTDSAFRLRLGEQALQDVQKYTWRHRVHRVLDFA